MRFENESKLQDMQEYYEKAVAAAAEAHDDFIKHRAQYGGDNSIDGSNEKASFVRNITYEIIESQVACDIPSARVDITSYSAGNVRRAEAIERLCDCVRNRLDFERINDIMERDAPVTGVSVLLIEWDETIRRHGVVGDVVATVIDPMDFFPQPNRYRIEDMDYCFIRERTTKRDIVEKYGVSYDTADDLEAPMDYSGGGDRTELQIDDDTVEVVTCFYYDDTGRLSKYVFSGDIELEDVPNYYARKRKICTHCGEREGVCQCEEPEYVLEDEEYEELTEDIHVDFGSESGKVISALSPKFKNGKPVTKMVMRQVTDERGAPIFDDLGLPLMAEAEEYEKEPTRIPWYAPKSMPIVIRTNITRADRWYGQSDCDFIRPYQQEVNKIESRIHAKLIGSSVIPVLPADSEFRLDNSINARVLRLREGENKGMYGVIDTSVNIAADSAQAERVYDMCKRAMGITDSFQGQQDSSAQSGRAKQIQVNQSAGRLASKRTMKQVAFAEMDRIIFELYLAFADEPRDFSYIDAFGERQHDAFSRYSFVDYDEKLGKWYYYDDFLFSVEMSADKQAEEAALRTEIITLFSQGIFGGVTTEAVLRLWQSLEKLRHPLGRFNVEYYTKKLEQERKAIAQANGTGNVPPATNGGTIRGTI